MQAQIEAIRGTKPLSSTTVDYLSELEALLAPDVVRLDAGMRYDHQIKYVTARFESTLFAEPLELLHVTDVQHGHVSCLYKRELEYRDWVLAKPNRFMLWGGDMVDDATIASPGSPWENIFDGQSQVFQFCKLWAPARHRVLGYVGGNHERRSIKGFGDLGRTIATLLRIPYSAGQQFVDIHYGEHKPFKVSLWHGSGSAQTAGAKMQMIDRFMQKADSHLYLVGHLHDAMMKFGWRQERSRGKIRLIKIAGAMSSSFMEYFGNYAEVMALSPSDVLMTRCVLEPAGGWEITLR